MNCPVCGQTGRTNIGGQDYCSNCGAKLDNAATVANQTPVAPPPAVTVKPKKFLGLFKRDQATSQLTPTTAAAPVANATAADPNPANQLHTGTVTGQVLDLRQVTPTPATAPVAEVKSTVPIVMPSDNTPNPPAPKPLITTSEPLEVKPVAVPVTPEPAPAPTLPEPAPAAAPVSVSIKPNNLEQRLANAATVTKSEAIQKFAAPVQAGATFMPEPPPSEPAVANPGSPAATPNPEPTQEMPNAVAAQLEKLNQLTPPAAPTIPIVTDHQAVLKQALAAAQPKPKAKLRPASLVAAALAIVIMGGYVWLSNYPKLALKTASDQAGFEASLPHYLPSNFRLAGTVAYSPGQITANFHSPNQGQMVVTERRTAWDSGSLLDNYVSRQSDQYLTVQGQGLTIYFYNNNHASWVNRGVWYSIEGDYQVAREDVMKVAYSL